MSKRKIIVYEHKNLKNLEMILKKYKRKRKLIITDGVFSMDGDIAPLDKISTLSRTYNAMLMVDEAHSTGILGSNGTGTLEYFHLRPMIDVDIILGTFSKALASTGGFVVGSSDLIRYLRVSSRSYIFSTAMTPAASASIIKAIDVINREPCIREKMWENANYLKNELLKNGFNTLDSETQIIPILIGSDQKAIQFSRRLFDLGIYGPCVRWPAVEKEMSRIRFTVMSTHTKQQIDYLVKCCVQIGKELKMI